MSTALMKWTQLAVLNSDITSCPASTSYILLFPDVKLQNRDVVKKKKSHSYDVVPWDL